MKLYDITHALGNSSACWPGDTPFHLELTARIATGDSVNVSAITLSPHNGTHMDAPFHYEANGAQMHEVPLDLCMGPAQVVELSNRSAVTAADLCRLPLAGAERLLVRTNSCPDPTRFAPDFTYFEPAAIAYLAARGVRLLGTDAHSVDPCESTELPAHKACAAHQIIIMENLDLRGVPEGRYELIALPLRLTGADASPVRAVLRAESPA